MADLNAGWIDHDGVFFPAGSPVLTAGNRGFRYADGLFETMLVRDGSIRLASYHFDRLLKGAALLGFASSPLLEPRWLGSQAIRLCERNGHTALARVRLAVFRGDGGLFDPSDEPHYVLESWPLTEDQLQLNEKGLVIDVFPHGRKACDPLSNLKTSNFLLYVLGARYASSHGSDDCLVLNTAERIADSCISNLFYTKGGTIYTPPLSEGCVAGVMRRWLLERLGTWGFKVEERPITVTDLHGAEEIFLTNALRAVRWVGEFGGNTFRGELAREVFEVITKEA